MKLIFWLDALLISLSLILIQVTDSRYDSSKTCYEDEDEDDYYKIKNVGYLERIIYRFPEQFSKFVESAVRYLGTLAIIFKKTFVENEVASLENLSILSDVFNTGQEMQDCFYDMIYVVIGEPRED